METARTALKLLPLLLFLLPACSRPGGSRTPPIGGGGGGGGSLPPKPAEMGGWIGALPGEGSVIFHFKLPPSGVEAALFQAGTPSLVFSGTPVASGLKGGVFQLQGLQNGISLFFGLGIREKPEDPWVPAGLVIEVRPGSPLYVDASAPSQGADGKSMETAFPDLADALSLAAAQGGGNLWIREGSYPGNSFVLSPGTHLYGGFDGGFDPLERDPQGSGTRIEGTAGPVLFLVPNGAFSVVCDGLVLDGRGLTAIGIDSERSPLDLRSVQVNHFNDRGLRLRNSSLFEIPRVRISRCEFRSNGADGLSVNGAYDLGIDGSLFAFNRQEGGDLDDLIALDGGTSSVRVSASGFFGNGTEGLDLDLAAPPMGGTVGGSFLVSIRGSAFEGNGAAGLLVDEEYEFFPLWRGSILVQGCRSRANRGPGFHVDADASADVLLHRLLASANQGDGIWISSESRPGFVTVSSSVLLGNQGAGMRASLGYQPILASHCILAGNFGGGIVSSQVESSTTSCLAYLQDLAWSGTRTNACVEARGTETFVGAPSAFARVTSLSGDRISISGVVVAPGTTLELMDDGVRRLANQVSGPTLVLDRAPGSMILPGLLSVFSGSTSVEEDFHLAPGAPSKGKGMRRPGGPATDPGVWGSPGAGKPGIGDPLSPPPFRAIESSPPPSSLVGSTEGLSLRFSADLDPDSTKDGRVRVVDDQGRELGVTIAVQDDRLLLFPPRGGWGSRPFRVELHQGLRSRGGSPLAVPLTLPFLPR